MNKNNYRLVFSRLRNMLVAVEETATATGKEAGQSSQRRKEIQGVVFTLRQITFVALMLLGALPSWSSAQIVPGGANAPGVIATQNGLPQVNINRPSGAGVSMNTYGQFDVQKNGAILNNSPSIVQTQQAGMINGNPNFGPGQSARVIVNQVNSSAASQINGRLEVAGQRAEVVIANGSGISVNGGGFINTSRAILTTGTPNFAPDGSLSGFNVTHGNISVQGAGLNAADNYLAAHVASFLLTFAEYVRGKQRPLLRGDVVGPSVPVIPGVTANSVYATNPVIFPETLACYDGDETPTVIVWLLPLMEAECSFVKEHGWDRFEDALENANPDLLLLNRPPII